MMTDIYTNVKKGTPSALRQLILVNVIFYLLDKCASFLCIIHLVAPHREECAYKISLLVQPQKKVHKYKRLLYSE